MFVLILLNLSSSPYTKLDELTLHTFVEHDRNITVVDNLRSECAFGNGSNEPVLDEICANKTSAKRVQDTRKWETRVEIPTASSPKCLVGQ